MTIKTVSTTTGMSGTPGVSYVEWSSVLAGAVLALALSFILLQFGGLIGLSVFEPVQSDEKTRWMVVAIGLWLFWVQLMSSMAGGYLAGRMRGPIGDSSGHESEVRDGAHGLLVWATCTLVIIAASAIASALASMGVDHTHATAHHADVAENLTKNAGIIFGFAGAAGSLVSAAAACWLSTIGGDHRNKGLRFTAFRRGDVR